MREVIMSSKRYPDEFKIEAVKQVVDCGHSSSITYRIAVGPQQGRKAFMIRTIRPLDRPYPGVERVARANGFSLHAGVSCEGHQKEKRERLCRYIARPAVAVPRLSLSSTGKVVYTVTANLSIDYAGSAKLDRKSVV